MRKYKAIFQNKEYAVMAINFVDNEVKLKSVGWMNLDNVNLLQYTGLNDIKDNCIYENDKFDVLFAKRGSKEFTKVTGTVVFKFGAYFVEFTHPIYGDVRCTDLFDFLKNPKEIKK